MREVKRVLRFPLSRLKENSWKARISGSIKDPERLEWLEESMEVMGCWPGAVGRLINEKGEVEEVPDVPAPVSIKDGWLVELGNFSHRLQAAIHVLGNDCVVAVGVGNFSDAEMLQLFVMSNRFADFTSEERQNVVGYAIQTLASVQSVLLREGKDSIGPTAVSKFLAEKTWSKQRVSEIMGVLKLQKPPVFRTNVDSVRTNDSSSVGGKTVRAPASDVVSGGEVPKLPETQELKVSTVSSIIEASRVSTPQEEQKIAASLKKIYKLTSEAVRPKNFKLIRDETELMEKGAANVMTYLKRNAQPDVRADAVAKTILKLQEIEREIRTAVKEGKVSPWLEVYSNE